MTNENTDFSTTPGNLDIDLDDQDLDDNDMDGDPGDENASGRGMMPSGSKGGQTRDSGIRAGYNEHPDPGTASDIGGADTDATGSGLSGIGNSGAKGGSTRTGGITGDGIDQDVDSGVGPDVDEDTARDTPIDEALDSRTAGNNPF